jgi:hypothetical protein
MMIVLAHTKTFVNTVLIVSQTLICGCEEHTNPLREFGDIRSRRNNGTHRPRQREKQPGLTIHLPRLEDEMTEFVRPRRRFLRHA